jgi:integrase
MCCRWTGCGLRCSEAFGLDVDAIEMLPHVLQVRQQLRLVNGGMVLAPPKNHKERSIPLPEPVALALAAHLAAFPPTAVTLPWRTVDGPRRPARLVLSMGLRRAVRRNNFNSSVWRPAITAAGMTPSRETGTHQLRHRYASLLVASGMNVRRVAEYMGHQDGGALLLRTYSHLMPAEPDRVRRAVEAALTAETRPVGVADATL